jgi:hypothetical protein
MDSLITQQEGEVNVGPAVDALTRLGVLQTLKKHANSAIRRLGFVRGLDECKRMEHRAYVEIPAEEKELGKAVNELRAKKLLGEDVETELLRKSTELLDLQPEAHRLLKVAASKYGNLRGMLEESTCTGGSWKNPWHFQL